MPLRLFRWILAVFILVLGVVLLWRPGRRESEAKAGAAEANGAASNAPPTFPFNRGLGVLISLVVGYVSSLLGIGGGIIHVSALVNLLGFPVHVATATSHFVVAVMSGTSTLTHVATGAFHHGVRRTIMLGIGVVCGAPLGASLSRRMHGAWIIRALGGALAFVGLRLLLSG